MKRLRDLWRGYSDADMESLHRKLSGPSDPATVIRLTAREHKAMRHYWQWMAEKDPIGYMGSIRRLPDDVEVIR